MAVAPVEATMAAGDSAGRETPDVSELRREVVPPGAIAGGIVWADNPAPRLQGMVGGDTLVSRAAPGTSVPLRRLFESGVEDPLCAGRPCVPDREAVGAA